MRANTTGGTAVDGPGPKATAVAAPTAGVTTAGTTAAGTMAAGTKAAAAGAVGAAGAAATAKAPGSATSSPPAGGAKDQGQAPKASPAAGAQGAQAPASSSTPPRGMESSVSPSKRGTREKMTRLRKVIAQRMVESLQVSAQLTTVVEVDMTKIARVRARTKADFERREGTKLSFLPFIALATAEECGGGGGLR